MLRAAFVGTERFRIVRELGTGGMGTVYEAFDSEKSVHVALKTLRRPDPKSLTRFKREFRAVSGLEHANVVSLGELLESRGQWFFTMELVPGRDFLSYVTATNERLATEEAGVHGSSRAATERDDARLRSALRQLAQGLAALHARGLVHRDMKPSNVLVTPEGRTVVMDFGLVTELGMQPESTQAHAVGTAAYMAPEQARGDQVTAMADWYSVGVMLYEALTGRLPFDGPAISLLMDKLQYEPVPPRAHVPGVAPDLDALCVSLLRLDPALRPPPREIFKRLGLDVPAAAPSVSSSHSAPGGSFVGRSAELALLDEALDAAREGPVVVLVEGESGMGKTALVEQFLDLKIGGDPQLVALRGRCYEREQVPFKAFDGVADSLCRLLVHMDEKDVARAMPLYAGLLPQLFPALKRVEAIARAPVVPALPDPQAQRTRMFGAFRELLLRLAARLPLVVFLDDLQWTCADSLTLFEEVFGHEDAPPVLIIATLRPVAEHTRNALKKAIEVVRELRSMTIGALTPREAHALASWLMTGRSADTIEALVRESGGHPLFVQELARHTALDERGGSSLDALLRARIAELTPQTFALLSILCVAGRPITQEVAALAARLDGTEFARASSLLRVAHLGRTDGSRSRDTIGPYHDRVREVVISMLDDAQRSAAHDRLTTALEQTGGDARAIVRHAVAAGQRERAAANALVAAETACATMAFDQASEFYETALELGSHEPQPRLRLQLARAETLKSAGRCREAAEAFMAAAQAAQVARAEPSLSVHCQIQAVEQWLISGHLAEGFAASTELLTEIDEPMAKTPARAAFKLVTNRLRLRMTAERFPEREETEIDRVTLNRLDVLRAMAMGLTFTDLIRCADFSVRFLLRAEKAGEPVRLVQGLGVEACFLAAQGGRAGVRARALLERMAKIAATRAGDPYFAGYLPGIEGIVCMNEGRFVRGAELMERAEQEFIGLRSRNMLERNAVQLYRMVCLRLAGRLSACRTSTAAFLRDANRRGDTYFAATLSAYRTQDLLTLGRLEQAWDFMKQTPWTPMEDGYHLQHYFALDARGELALYERNAETALTELAPSIAGLERSLLLHNRLLRIVYRWLCARLHVSAARTDRGKKGQEKAAAREAARLAREGSGCATTYALLTRAALSHGANKTEDAVALLRSARDTAHEHRLASCAAAAAFRLGQLVQGAEGAALIEEARSFCAAEGVAAPELYFEVLAPGFCSA